jgi:hypothetical protein
VDDQRLSELFRVAVGDAPPASFDEKDIVAASHRVTDRRRSLLLGGGGLVVVLLALGLLLGTGLLRHTVGSGVSGANAVAGGPTPLSTGRGPEAAVPGLIQSFPWSTSVQGGVGTGKVGTADGTHAGCGPVDGDLAVALAGELPSAGAQVPVPTSVRCPAGSRSAAVTVPGGVVIAVLVPIGSGFSHPGLDVATSGKWTVLVQGAPASAVPAGQLAAVRQHLAARY